jgi:spore germination cell wall hydrolase CwlJ-like protein
LSVGIQARADRRALANAAYLGSSFGVALGAVYLLAGLGPAAHTHADAVRLARTSQGDLAETMLQRNTNGKDRGLGLLVRARATGAAAGDAQTAQSWPGRFGAHLPLGKRASMIEAERDLDCLTEAVYFEARSESDRGQAAVAQVVMNRLASPSFPKSVCGVVFQGAQRPGCQFTFACDGSMRQPLELAAWDRARKVAEQALAGVRVAAIGESTHYHTTAVEPYWNVSMVRVAQVGLHIFYRRNPHWIGPRDDDGPRVAFAKAPAAAAPNLRLVSAAVAKSLEVATGSGRPAETARAAETVAVPASETFRTARGSADPAAF